MKRSRPNIPAGAAGAGLLVARVSLAVLLVGLARPLPLAAAAALSALAFALAAGQLTRAAAGLGGLAVAACGLTFGGKLGLSLGLHSLDAAALVLLGGGAYSLDGWLFGRRIIPLDG